MQFINNENIKNNDSSEEDTDEILLPVFIREENVYLVFKIYILQI